MRKALCVGINAYPNGNALHACLNDANEIAQLLKKNSDESPNFEVLLENDVPDKATLRSHIAKLFSGDCETALFYFSGHGFLNELGGFLVTPDFTQYDEGVSMNDILSFANQSKIKDKIIILDCCHAGKMGSPNVDNQTTQIGEGLSILTACRDNESAIELGNGHGIFTNLLIEALKGGASDLLGNITPAGIYSFIDQALGAWYQRPVFKTNITRFTPLRKVKPPVSIDVLRSIKEYFHEPTEEYPLDPSYEYTNTPSDKHQLVKPYATEEHIHIFKDLQKLQSVGLVVPCGEQFMYYAAMNSKTCKLTPLGQHYWQLAIKELV
ncbi:MAG: caspase family protein [Spirochaetaceae bacterium]|jgi:hypothetical protein|nr:caspase family protein [Spirochaetaceae bacterium]